MHRRKLAQQFGMKSCSPSGPQFNFSVPSIVAQPAKASASQAVKDPADSRRLAAWEALLTRYGIRPAESRSVIRTQIVHMTRARAERAGNLLRRAILHG